MSRLREIVARGRAAGWQAGFALARQALRPGTLANQFDWWSPRVGAVALLRAAGATVADSVGIERWLKFQNARGGSLENLTIEENAYVGPDVLIDLVSPVFIGADVAIAGRVSIVTHHSVGAALSRFYPRSEGAVTIRRGAFIGFGATICKGVTVGEEAVVAAGAVVLHDVAPRTVVAGVPAQYVKDVAARGER